MSVEENVAAFRRLIEQGFNAADLAVVDEIVAPDCVEHQRGNRPGSEGVKEVIATLHRWMSDFTLSIEDLIAEGDMVWTRNRARGINTGSFMGHAPTGRTVEVDVIDIGRFAGGRLVEHWGIADQLGLMLQLGQIPGRGPTAPASEPQRA